jgi:magnesium transporter
MLIACTAYQKGHKIADIPVSAIGETLKGGDAFVWVALKDPTADELDSMAVQFDLHPLAVEDARKGHQRPKIEEYGDSLFCVLQPVELIPNKEGEKELLVGEVDVFVGKNYILSVRHRTQTGFAAVRTRTEREPELLQHGSAFVLYALIDNVVDRYFPIIDDLETRLEDAEERLFTSASSMSKIEELYALKRELMVLKHAVEPLMEGLTRLFGGRVPQICAGTQEYFRDVYDHLVRISQSIDGIREMLSTAIQVNLGLINLGETEVTKKLAGWAAILAVPTLIAGVYGMNFKFMPEYEWSLGYPFALALMFAIDVVLYFWFKRIRWL